MWENFCMYSRMYWTTAEVRELTFYVRLNEEFHSDLHWWCTFLGIWNGLCFLQCVVPGSQPDHCIQTDASGAWGCAAYFEGKWFQHPWSQDWIPCSIIPKELVPISLGCGVYMGTRLCQAMHFIPMWQHAVAAIKKGASKDPFAMAICGTLWHRYCRRAHTRRN